MPERPPVPRVLLLEDDGLVRHFVREALDGMALELLPCASLAEARRMLSSHAVALVLADLHLPDGSGLDLLRWLRERGGDCRTVVFSGGVDEGLSQRLLQQGVWRVLHKPVSVGGLIGCVEQALALHLAGPGQEGPQGMAEASVVARYFGGDRALYVAYRGMCLKQFPIDVADGDRAADHGDAPALHRVVHNLKSVLALLGQERAAQLARSIEDQAARGVLPPMRADWQHLRQQVLAYRTQCGA
ncbi:response regulator [Alicycliphilus sp. T452]|jgi:CheY-like chemotaxis protein